MSIKQAVTIGARVGFMYGAGVAAISYFLCRHSLEGAMDRGIVTFAGVAAASTAKQMYEYLRIYDSYDRIPYEIKPVSTHYMSDDGSIHPKQEHIDDAETG